MIKIFFLLSPLLLLARSPFETVAPSSVDTSAYETKKREENVRAAENARIKCRYICDKKVYKEQKISDAIEFYKNSKNYNFSMN